MDVNQVINDTVEIVRSQGVLKNITLNIDLTDKIPQVVADPGQLSQVVINLLLNSRDSIGKKGEISIATEGSYEHGVRISVRDNGAGIPRDIRDRIFDPFFTTKEPGQGTGLGLSVSARIIDTFEGKITVQSEEGRGTLFEIIFPAARNYEHAENFGG